MDSKTHRLRVGAFQFAGSGNIYKNLAAIKRGIQRAAQENIRLLLTQECALCGYPPVEVATLEKIDQNEQRVALETISTLAKEHNMFIILGLITFEEACAFNTLIVIDSKGNQIKSYHKRALWGWDTENFTPGNSDNGTFWVDGIRVGVRICYEVRFPEYFRELFRQKVDLAAISFVDVGKPEQSQKIEIIKSHLISRAAENAIFVLSANSTSQQQLAPTCLINPDGHILGKAPLNQEALLTGEIEIIPPNFGRQGRIAQSKMLTEL
jgi:predicted amidohydrolase